MADSDRDFVWVNAKMSSNPVAIADSVVEAFKARIGPEASRSLDQHHFEALHGMVREAIAEHAEAIIERLDQDLKQAKADLVERRPLEL